MQSESQYRFGPFRLDVYNQRLWAENREILLPPKAFALLAYLVERAGRLVTRSELLEAIWPGTHVDDHTISVHIREIRVALGDEAKRSNYIETRHRRGYSFRASVRELTSSTEFHRPAASNSVVPFPVDAAQQIGPMLSPKIGAQGPHAIPETKYAQSGDLNIAYQVIGEGPIDLVFVMGWVSHLEYFWHEANFARFLRRLASFSRLIVFDKRGTGLSDRVPITALPTLEQRMDDLRAVMDAVGSKKAVVCGISEGGPLSTVFAATYPERTLAVIMIGSYAKRIRSPDYPWGQTPEQHEDFIRTIQREWGGPVGLEVRAPSMTRDPVFTEWWSTYLRMGASPGAAVALTRMNAQVDTRGILPLVRVPTLVIHRTADKLFHVDEGRYVASRIPNSKFVELPGNDHLPFVGNQDSIVKEIRGFVSGLTESISGNRVLATIMVAEFVGIAEADTERLQARVASELDWFRGLSIVTKPPRLVASFDGPARAIRCACAMSDHASDFGVAIRAGLHTGECADPRSPHASGPAVDVATLIQSRSQPGEILVSSTMRDLVSGSGIEFADRSELDAPGLESKRRILCVIG